MSDAVAVVGAGCAGAAAAHELAREGIQTTVLERADRVGGRASTCRRAGCTFETGANYLRTSDEAVTSLFTEQLPTDGLVPIASPVWTVGADGTVGEGRSDQEIRYTYESGLSELPRRLLATADVEVRRDWPVQGLAREEGGWVLDGPDGEVLGPVSAVILTPPGPESAAILEATGLSGDIPVGLQEELAAVSFRPIVSVALGYEVALERPYYALVNADGGNEVEWIAREGCKPGHVPAGESVLLVQWAGEWSAEHLDASSATVESASARAAATILEDHRLRSPEWSVDRRWRYAAPETEPPEALLEEAAAVDLVFAGDWARGGDRLDDALRSGIEAAEAVAGRR